MPPARTDETEPTEDSLAKIGRQLTRTVDMFWCPIEVLSLGKKVSQMNAQTELNFQNSASAKQKRVLALVDKLIDLDPMVITRLNQGGSNTGALTRYAKQQLRIGQSNGKSEDMRKVKDIIEWWKEWDPPLPRPDNKVNRGLKHIECAYLLSDTSVDWEDETARTRFTAFSDPPMDASAWGRFLRPHGQYNPNRPSDGLLQGELLIKAAHAILFSPASSKSASASTSTGARGRRRNRTIGIAKSYQLTEVTPSFIAYVAVVVRHSLTSDEIFSENCGGFDYTDFYDQIREYLEAPRFQRRATMLLDWWNQQVFSERRLGEILAPPNRRVNGTLAGLDAEIEAEESGGDGEHAGENGERAGGNGERADWV